MLVVQATTALCRALLLHDFGVRWTIPGNRLCPTVPSRLNYLLWIEDLLALGGFCVPVDTHASVGASAASLANRAALSPFGPCCSMDSSQKLELTECDYPPLGVDVGTGASCIYPLLGVALLGWRFIATEIDERSTEAARHNVELNNWADRIDVRRVVAASSCNERSKAHAGASPHSSLTPSQTHGTIHEGAAPILVGVLHANEKAHFVMCNPPFFDDSEAPTTRKDGVASSLAAPNEQFTAGGEVGFISRMISDSIQLGEQVIWYSSLVGRKASLPRLLEQLRHANVKHVRQTELAQGQTSRWAIAWSFVEGAAPRLEPLQKAPFALKPTKYCKIFHVGNVGVSEVHRRVVEEVHNSGVHSLEVSQLDTSSADEPSGTPVLIASGVAQSHQALNARKRKDVTSEDDAQLESVAPLVEFGFELWLRPSTTPTNEDSCSHPCLPSAEDHTLSNSVCIELRLVSASNHIWASPEREQSQLSPAFWHFADRVRNAVVRDTRKWRRLSISAGPITEQNGGQTKTSSSPQDSRTRV